MPSVCFISYEIHPTTAGGCGVLIRHAADRINATGWGVVFLLDIPRDLFDRFIAEQIPLFADPAKVKAYHVNDLIPPELQEPQSDFDIFRLKSRRFAASVETLLSREQIDIVECFDYCGPGYDLSVRALFREDTARTSIVTRIHGSIEVLERVGGGMVRDRSRMSQLACERAALRLSESVLTPSRTYFEDYYVPLYGLNPTKAHVSTPPKRGIGTVSDVPDSELTSIVFVGRLFHLKGVDTLIFAAAQLMREFPDENFVVDLIGYDSTETPFPEAGPMYGDYLRSVIPADLFHRFRFRGQVSHDDILDSLKSARFAVFPNRVESFCYALHEIYDAGVPVIVNDLPAFRDFFIDQVNCLTFNGTVTDLIERMRRLFRDAELRRAITRPHPVAESGFADWYLSHDRAFSGTNTPESCERKTLVIVLADDAQSRDSCAGSESIRNLCESPSCDVIFATRCNPRFPGTCWILGESRLLTDRNANPIDPISVCTDDALLVLHQEDRFDPQWITDCMRALFRRDDIAFAGTWTTSSGVLRESSLDILPELEVFEHPRELHRVVLRTPTGIHLSDLFDPTLGPLGHLGLIWKTCAERGNGVLLPEGRMHTSTPAPLQPNVTHVKSLLLRYSAPFAENIAIYAGLTEPAALQPSRPVPVESATPSPEPLDRFAIAETLGGRTLLRMAVAKLMTRIKSLIS